MSYIRCRGNPSSRDVHLTKICIITKWNKWSKGNKRVDSEDNNEGGRETEKQKYRLKVYLLGFVICSQLGCSQDSRSGHGRAHPLPQSFDSLFRYSPSKLWNWSTLCHVWIHLQTDLIVGIWFWRKKEKVFNLILKDMRPHLENFHWIGQRSCNSASKHSRSNFN